MITITIIGTGNVAQHLIETLYKSSVCKLVQVFSRNNDFAFAEGKKIKLTQDWSKLLETDLYIIAVSDNAIEEVSNQIPFTNKIVVHTSGTTDMFKINSKNRRGVFYPLQSFSKQKAINFLEIPICLETENIADYMVLETIAKSISNVVYSINSEQRKSLHVAAVFVCNFVNHLYNIGEDICANNNIPFQILQPLIEETANKIKFLNPKEAQTGPAKRNDLQTIKSHLDFLKNENQYTIYKILTQSISNNGKEL